jgi:hypothetical protein
VRILQEVTIGDQEKSLFWFGFACGVAIGAAVGFTFFSYRQRRMTTARRTELPPFQILTRSDGVSTSETLTRWASIIYDDYRRHGDDEPKAVFRLVCELIHRGCSDAQVQGIIRDVLEGRSTMQWDNGYLSDLIEDAKRLESLIDTSITDNQGGRREAQ